MAITPEEPFAPATPPAPSRAGTALIALASATFGVGAGLACYGAAGNSLGLFFGGVLFAALLVPPLAMAADTWIAGTLNTLAALAGIAWVWAIKGVSESGTTTLEWARCSLVLLVFGASVALLAASLRALRLGPVFSSAIAVVLGLAWLTWPVWLATQVEGPRGPWLAQWLVPAHPLITLNGLLLHLGVIWNEQAVMYNLTKLGNEVAYDMPRTWIPAVAVHGGLAIAFSTIALVATKLRRNPKQH